MINDRHRYLTFSLKPRGIFLLEVFQMSAFDSANYTRWEGFPYLGWTCTSLQLFLSVKPRLLNEIIQYMSKLNEYFFLVMTYPWLWFIPGDVPNPTLLPYLSELDQTTYKHKVSPSFFFFFYFGLKPKPELIMRHQPLDLLVPGFLLALHVSLDKNTS